MSSQQTPAPTRGIVESVMRASRLLDCFERGRPEMSLSEFVARAGYSKTTTYRLLTTLERAGWLDRTPEGAFRLTIKPFQLGTILVDSLELRQEAGPAMAELARIYDDTVYLLVPANGQAVCLERIDSGQAVRTMALEVGGSQPFHLGAGPRALLAFRQDELLPQLLEAGLSGPTDASLTEPGALLADLEASRARGYTLSRSDMTPGLGAVGAPIFDRSGLAVAALSIGGLVERFDPPRDAEVGSGLAKACARLSRRLGYLPGV